MRWFIAGKVHMKTKTFARRWELISFACSCRIAPTTTSFCIPKHQTSPRSFYESSWIMKLGTNKTLQTPAYIDLPKIKLPQVYKIDNNCSIIILLINKKIWNFRHKKNSNCTTSTHSYTKLIKHIFIRKGEFNTKHPK